MCWRVDSRALKAFGASGGVFGGDFPGTSTRKRNRLNGTAPEDWRLVAFGGAGRTLREMDSAMPPAQPPPQPLGQPPGRPGGQPNRPSRTPLRLVGGDEASESRGVGARKGRRARGAEDHADAESVARPGQEFGRGVEAEREESARRLESSRFIAYENASAARHSDGARLAFAKLVEESIEGGRAAIIRPETRRELAAAAETRGLRPFEAQLTIAMVQDAARHGEVIARAGREADERRARHVPRDTTPGGCHDPSPRAAPILAAPAHARHLMLAVAMGVVIFASLVVAVLRA